MRLLIFRIHWLWKNRKWSNTRQKRKAYTKAIEDFKNVHRHY